MKKKTFLRNRIGIRVILPLLIVFSLTVFVNLKTTHTMQSLRTTLNELSKTEQTDTGKENLMS